MAAWSTITTSRRTTSPKRPSKSEHEGREPAGLRRHVLPEPRRAPDEHLAPHWGDTRAIAAFSGKTYGHKLLDNERARCAALCRAGAHRLQRLPLIGREVVVELGIHAASKNQSFHA